MECLGKDAACGACGGKNICGVCGGSGRTEAESRFYNTAWSLLPPLIAITLALITKEVYSSLFIGIAAGGLLAVAGSGILLYMGAHHLVKRGMSGPSITLWTVLLGGLSLGICALALYRSRSGGRKKLEFVCLWGTVYLLAGLAAINIIKAVWQRTRFDDMLTAAGGGFEGAFAQFTSWMQPFGNGGSSFPSGHTAAACSVFILTLACDVCLKWNRRRTLVWALCWAYVAFMALCRLVIGRHYLSDTLAAAFVMLLLYLGMRKTKWYRAGARELTAPGT